MNVSLNLPSGNLSLPGKHFRFFGSAFHDGPEPMHVSICLDGKWVDAVWGLPNIASYDGSFNSYMSGVTALISLGSDAYQREHKISALVKFGDRTIEIPTSTFAVTKDIKRDQPSNIAAGTYFSFRDFGNSFLSLMISEGLKPNHDVIEIGPGAGRLSVALARYLMPIGRLQAFDVDENAIQFCRENISAMYPSSHFEKLDVRNGIYNLNSNNEVSEGLIPIENSSQNFCYCWSVFTHLIESDFKNYLREFVRLLKPGGKAIFSYFEHTPEKLKIPFFPIGNGFWTSNLSKPEAAIAIDRDALLKMLIQFGFSNIVLREISKDYGPLGGQNIAILERA